MKKAILNEEASQDYELADILLNNQNHQHQIADEYYNAVKLEEQFIKKYSDLELNINLKVKNVYLNETESQWIHTMIYEENVELNSIPIVLTHGYSQSSLCFYKMIKNLGKNRRVYALDWIGQGLSSRPDFTLEDSEEIIKYFINSLETWREKVKLDKFILVGHSFGGFISAHYAIHHASRVSNLHLISPLGSTKVTERQSENYAIEYENKLCCINRILYKKLIKKGWYNFETPQSLMQWRCIPTSCFLGIIAKCLWNMKYKESLAFKNFCKSVYNLKQSTYIALHYLVSFPRLSAHHNQSLQEILPMRLKNYVHFYFGDSDWMDQEGAQILIQSKLVSGTFTIIEKSGHDIQFDNPKSLVDKILENEEKYEDYDFQIKQQLDLQRKQQQQINQQEFEMNLNISNNIEDNKQFNNNQQQNYDI